MKKFLTRLRTRFLWGRGRKEDTATPLLTKARRGLLQLSVSFSLALMMAPTVFAADDTAAPPSAASGGDIWQWLGYALNDVYQKFLSVSTIAACVAASICLIMMNFSTDDRAVATSRAWLKRILISWVILNVLGFIMVYLSGITTGGSYVPSGGQTSTP